MLIRKRHRQPKQQPGNGSFGEAHCDQDQRSPGEQEAVEHSLVDYYQQPYQRLLIAVMAALVIWDITQGDPYHSVKWLLGLLAPH